MYASSRSDPTATSGFHGDDAPAKIAADAAGEKVDVSFVPAARPAKPAAAKPASDKPAAATSSPERKRRRDADEGQAKRPRSSDREPESDAHRHKERHRDRHRDRDGEMESRDKDRHQDKDRPGDSREGRSSSRHGHRAEPAAEATPAASQPAAEPAPPGADRAPGVDFQVLLSTVVALGNGLSNGSADLVSLASLLLSLLMLQSRETCPDTGPAHVQVLREGKDMGQLQLAMSSGGQTATFGRAPGCEVVLEHASISRRHATLALDHACTLTIVDLNSGAWLRRTESQGCQRWS